MDSNLLLLLGRGRALVLRALFQAAQSGVALHLRELARRTGLSPTAVQYELRLLRQLDLIRDIGTENRPLFVLNREHDLYEDLGNMFTRATSGVLFDDSHFAHKRILQREDRRQGSESNSPFLRRLKP